MARAPHAAGSAAALLLEERGPLATLGLRAYRSVEAQHVIGTRKLVDSAEEHELLEALIERSKPPVPKDEAFRGLHYLLATSFRYPPLRHGTRFGTRAEPSLWYGSERLETTFAEAAYYRLVFLEGTAADLAPVAVELSAFHVGVRTERGVDLTEPPFAEFEERLASPSEYGESQAAGRAMRELGVEAFRFRSARDPGQGTNVGVFTPRAFAQRRPAGLTSWHCIATREVVEIVRRDLFSRRQAYRFPRSAFVVHGRLPVPAL